jgi:hypothetical protein
MGDTLWNLHTCLHYILIRCTPPSFSLIPPPFLEQFQPVSLFCFHAWIQNTSATFALLYPFLILPPTSTYPWTGPVLPSWLSFFKCILIVQGGFTLIFHTCNISHTLIRLTPTTTFSPIIQQLLVHCAILSSYTNAKFQCFSISNILFSSPDPNPHRPLRLYYILSHIPLSICPGVVWLDRMEVFSFWGTSILLSIAVTLIYIPTNSV